MVSYPTHPDLAWTYPVSASAYPAAAHGLLPGSSVPLTGVGEVPYLQAIAISPLAAVTREYKKMQAQGGLGAPSDKLSGSAAAGILAVGALIAGAVLLTSGVGGYYTGKAVAPSREKRTKYGLIGIPVAMLTGPVGLGVMAFVGGRNR